MNIYKVKDTQGNTFTITDDYFRRGELLAAFYGDKEVYENREHCLVSRILSLTEMGVTAQGMSAALIETARYYDADYEIAKDMNSTELLNYRQQQIDERKKERN